MPCDTFVSNKQPALAPVVCDEHQHARASTDIAHRTSQLASFPLDTRGSILHHSLPTELCAILMVNNKLVSVGTLHILAASLTEQLLVLSTRWVALVVFKNSVTENFLTFLQSRCAATNLAILWTVELPHLWQPTLSSSGAHDMCAGKSRTAQKLAPCVHLRVICSTHFADLHPIEAWLILALLLCLSSPASQRAWLSSSS